jgi:predicted N-acetyltransferase YhbS
MNAWFRRHAGANHASGTSRVNVICDATSGKIVGYVTLSAAQIERAFLPRAQQRNKPDPVPATLLGQLAIHKDYQGQGHAGSLLLFALKTSLRAAEAVGSLDHASSRRQCARLLRKVGLPGPPIRSAPRNDRAHG